MRVPSDLGDLLKRSVRAPHVAQLPPSSLYHRIQPRMPACCMHAQARRESPRAGARVGMVMVRRKASFVALRSDRALAL